MTEIQITRRGVYGARILMIEILSESTKKKRLLPESNEVIRMPGYGNTGFVDPEKSNRL